MATRKSMLFPYEREQVEALIDRLTLELESQQNGRGLKELVGEAVIKALRDAEERDELWATSARDHLAIDGVLTRIESRWNSQRGMIGHNGTVVRPPTRIGVQARDAEGVQERHYQQKLWWECTWQEFESYLAHRRHQLRGDEAIITAMESVLKLRAKYPDTLTPGEACERAGIDPRVFEVG